MTVDAENEGVTVGLLGWIRWPIIADTPIVSSVLRTPVAIPQKISPVIYNNVCAKPTHKIRYGVSVMILEVVKRYRTDLSVPP